MNGTAALALLGTVGLLAALVLRYVLPESVAGALALGVLGGVLVALALALDFHRVRRALASPVGVARLSSVVRGSLLVGAVAAANVLALTVRVHVDLTEGARLSLSDQSRAALSTMRRPVEALVLFTADADPQVVAYSRDLLAEYRHAFPRLTVHQADPIGNPEIPRRYRLDEAAVASGVVVFNGTAGRSFVTAQQIERGAEAAFTSAILTASGERLPVIYLATGHGERGRSNGYGRAVEALAGAPFAVKEIDVRHAAAVPADAAALLLVGPASPMAARTTRALDRYLQGGGRLLLAFDPDPDPSVVAFLASHAIQVRPGAIVDADSHAEPDVADVLVPADRNAFGLDGLHFPGLAPVRPSLDMPDRVLVTALGMTSARAVTAAETAPAAVAAARATATARSLPIGLLTAVPGQGGANAVREQRMVVLGDTDFASDDHLADGANAALFVTLVKWLADGRETVPIAPQLIGDRRFLVSPEQARFIGLSSIALLPILVLAIGGLVWWRRS